MWDIIGYGVLCLFVLLLLVLCVPVYVRVTYREEWQVLVRMFGITVYRFPSAKTMQHVKVKDESVVALAEFAKRFKRDSVGETVKLFEQLACLTAGTTRRLLSATTVDKLTLQLYVAGTDAAQTAQACGRTCAILYPAITAVQQTVLRIRKREVTVTPDYLVETGRVWADVTAHAMPLRVAWIILGTLTRYGAITKRKKEVSCHGKQSAEFDGSVDR